MRSPVQSRVPLLDKNKAFERLPLLGAFFFYTSIGAGLHYGLHQRKSYINGSVVILGGLSLVNSLHAYTFASLKRKKLISTTPLNDALNALILALNASAAAFVLLFTKKFRILS